MKKNIVTMKSQGVEFPGVKNARQLGGYETLDGRRVSPGKLFRTAELRTASEESVTSFVKSHGIGHVIDLRGEEECTRFPEPSVDPAVYHWILILDEMKMKEQIAPYLGRVKELRINKMALLQMFVKCGVIADDLYVDFLRQPLGKKGYKDMFRILLEAKESEGILWHCTNGKDRTGVAAMLILSALNVDEETIMEDFLLTNAFFTDEIAEMKVKFEPIAETEEELDDMLVSGRKVSERYLRKAMDYLKESYGSVKNYITVELGVSQEEMELLREKYTCA